MTLPSPVTFWSKSGEKCIDNQWKWTGTIFLTAKQSKFLLEMLFTLPALFWAFIYYNCSPITLLFPQSMLGAAHQCPWKIIIRYRKWTTVKEVKVVWPWKRPVLLSYVPAIVLPDKQQVHCVFPQTITYIHVWWNLHNYMMSLLSSLFILFPFVMVCVSCFRVRLCAASHHTVRHIFFIQPTAELLYFLPVIDRLRLAI